MVRGIGLGGDRVAARSALQHGPDALTRELWKFIHQNGLDQVEDFQRVGGGLARCRQDVDLGGSHCIVHHDQPGQPSVEHVFRCLYGGYSW
jgi:hypothetical protein